MSDNHVGGEEAALGQVLGKRAGAGGGADKNTDQGSIL